jgi:hypothetical protein
MKRIELGQEGKNLKEEKVTVPATKFEIPSEVLYKPTEKLIKQVAPGIVTYSVTSSSVKATLVKKVFDEQMTKLE